MTYRRNPWMTLSMDAMRLGWEAQTVIGLRMIKAGMGGAAAEKEARLMVAEKLKAAADAQQLLAESLMTGQAALAPARTVSMLRRRVRANQRRLSQGG